MAKTKISEFSTTAGNNTDINSINIAEGCAPSGINDAIRELMRQLKEFQTGGAGDSVNSGGDFSVATNKFTVAAASGNTAVAGTLAVTGVATLTAQPILSSLTASKAVFTDASKGLVSNDVTGTGSVVMSNSPTLVTPALGTPSSGVVTNLTGTASININGTVGATTPSTGAFTTLSSTGNTTLGDADTDTLTFNASFVTGTTLKSAKLDTNTLALAAYDVDGTAYTNLVTLTAGNSPTLALTSTGVGTINNMSIGATTASTGAFTTLSASGNVTLSGGTANGVLYLNGSKVATAGTALTFDGTNLGVGTTATALSTYRGAEFAGTTVTTGGFLRMRTSDSSVNSLDFLDVNGRAIFTTTNHPLRFGVNDTEAMRLTSTGLGIGTSSLSSSFKLGVYGSNSAAVFQNSSTGVTASDGFAVGNFGGTTAYVYNYEADSLVFGTSGAEKMRLDSSGNLGLGVTPNTWTTYKALQVNSSLALMGDGAASIYGNNAYYNSGWKYANSNYAALYVQNNGGNGAHAWYTAPSGTVGNAITFTQAMTLNASGNLLVGTTSGSTNTVYRTDNSNPILLARNGSASGVIFGVTVNYSGQAPNNTASFFLQCNDTGAERCTIRSNGGIANYQANDANLSDRREKTNFAPAKDYLDTICAIPVQTFNYIDQSEDDPGTTLGVVAQDVQAVAPELVHESNWGTEEEPKMRLSIYQTDLQYALMKCIQEQQAQIESLRKRLADAGIA